MILPLALLCGCASAPVPTVTVVHSAEPPVAAAAPSAAVVHSPSAALLRMTHDIGEIGGGWIIAARSEWIDRNRLDLARQADESAERRPAVPADVAMSPTADLNGDGFVTMDEVIALRRAGLDDAGIIGRLDATGFVFSLTVQQAKYLQDRGISQAVIRAIRQRPARAD